MKKFIPFLLCFLTSSIFTALAQAPKMVTPIGHGSFVRSAQFSSDGKFIVTTSDDSTVKLWDVSTGNLLHTIAIRAFEAQISFDNKLILIAASDKTAKIWDIKIGSFVQSMQGHTDNVWGARFSSNGKFVITRSEDKTAKVWEAATGKLLFTLSGHSKNPTSAQFSPDGKFISTSSYDKTVKVWDATSGNLITTLDGHNITTGQSSWRDKVSCAEFSPDSKLIVSAGSDKTVKIWEASSGRLLNTLLGHSQPVQYAKFSASGKFVVTASEDDMTAKIWETGTGKLLHTLVGHNKELRSAEFSPNERMVVTASLDQTTKCWNATNGQLLYTIYGHTDGIFSAQFSPDGKTIATASQDKSAKIWNSTSGQLIQNLEGSTHNINSLQLSKDSKLIVSASANTAKVWDENSGRQICLLDGHSAMVVSAKFSADGQFVVTASQDKTAAIWKVNTGSLLFKLSGHGAKVNWAEFSPNGKRIVTGSADKTARVWEAATGKQLFALNGHSGEVRGAQFSSDGKYIVTASEDKSEKIWDSETGQLLESVSAPYSWSTQVYFSDNGKYFVNLESSSANVRETSTGKLLFKLEGHTGIIFHADFSHDGAFLVTSAFDNSAKIWDLNSGAIVQTLPHDSWVNAAYFSPDAKWVISATNKAAKIWEANSAKLVREFPFAGSILTINESWTTLISAQYSSKHMYEIATGKESISWVGLNKTDWVVVHPTGLFDATPDAMSKLYFVEGLTVIDFNQLKARYYEPGLWKRLKSGEAARTTTGFKSIELPPEVEVGEVDASGYLKINLTNKGGGIGEVNVFINGKEIIKDAREPNTKPMATTLALKVFIGKHKSILKGKENLITVKAWNTNHWVVSRGKIISYHSKEIEQYKPAIHILTCGISDYEGSEIDLKYAAKDANDVNAALTAGAKKLFGVDRSYVHNLTTSQSRKSFPTRVNILLAFEKITANAHPLDVFVMYVSGHGINYGGPDGDWYYLTQEANTSSGAAYGNSDFRTKTTISSNELVELFKKVPALKQVLILDACASGKVVDNLIAQKGIESNTLRALDRMRDRTGMHIITGCTADAVSYEASKYGQGVLTYSLLEGIRGAALREDQYVDINKLFQYAQDRVPQLAEGIGGIQSPQVFSPQGSQSFDIGLLGDDEKKEIPLSKIRPVFVRSNFLDTNEMEDVFGLSKLVDESLNEVSSRGVDSQIIFVDVREYPEGCKLTGNYKKGSNEISLSLKKRCGADVKVFELKGADINALKNEVIKIL